MAFNLTDWVAWIGAVTGVFNLINSSSQRKDQRKQQRASLSVGGGCIRIVDNAVIVEFEVFNRGGLSAENIKFAAVVAYVDGPQFHFLSLSQIAFPALEYRNHQPLANGASIWFKTQQYISSTDSELVLEGLKTIHVKGEIKYSDHFDNKGVLVLDSRQASRMEANGWALSPYEKEDGN